MKRRNSFLYYALILVLLNLPYAFGFLGNDDWHLFNGFILNPIDGNSYLAKMQLGVEGKWLFTLPFTSEIGVERFLFIFYILLGQVARITGIEPIIIFHLTRNLAFIFLLGEIKRFIDWACDDALSRKWAFFIVSMGSGLGWMVFLFGITTSDFWVSEAYPFLSAFINPHFPLGLALMMGMLRNSESASGWRLALLSIALALILPFGIVIISVTLGLTSIWRIWQGQKQHLASMIIGLLPGLAIIGYQYWFVGADKQLSIWNAQNLTHSPPAWDLVISLSPVIILAFLDLFFDRHNLRATPHRVLLWAWLGASLLLMYLPLPFQRRFITGLYIPAAILAIMTMRSWVKSSQKAYRVLLVLSIPTNIIILLAGSMAAVNRDPRLFITGDEYQAMSWIRSHTTIQDVILASPENGNVIPARTGRRVVYGHPFETVNAASKKSEVEKFYSDHMSAIETGKFLKENHVRYILYGPREKDLGTPALFSGLRMVFHSGDVFLYQAPES